jgi:ABC-type lipoprotein release transport system permease subunit
MKSEGIGFWTRMALLFLVRSGRSTGPLTAMVIIAVSALIFLSALAVGVNDAMLRNTVGLFSGHVTGLALAPTVRPKDLVVPGVAAVLKRVYLLGVLSGGRVDHSLMLCAIDPDREIALTGLPKKLVEGGYPRAGRSEMMIGKPLAEALGVQTGATLRFASPDLESALQLTVVGIYQTHIDRLDRSLVFCPLAAIPKKDLPWSAAVFLKHDSVAQRVIETYGQKWPDRYRFESWETTMPDLRQLIDLQYISMAMVIVLVFFVVAVGIACSLVIFILKNIREYGIMKAMGVTTRGMSALIVTQVGLINAAACAVGLCIGVLAVWVVADFGGIDLSAWTSHNQYFAVSGVIYPRLTLFSLLAPPATAFLFGLLSATWPAALLARRKAAEIMRMI